MPKASTSKTTTRSAPYTSDPSAGSTARSPRPPLQEKPIGIQNTPIPLPVSKFELKPLGPIPGIPPSPRNLAVKPFPPGRPIPTDKNGRALVDLIPLKPEDENGPVLIRLNSHFKMPAQPLADTPSSPPPRLPSPTMHEGATSFIDIDLPTLPDSDLPPIYDTCTQIRQKIRNLMSNKHPRPADGVPGKTTKDGKPKPWTIKEFCEVISWGGVCGAEEGVNVSSYSSFMKKRGTMGGCEGGTYSGANIFFEKKRIWEGQPKTDARGKREEENPWGLALQDDSAQVYVTKPIGNRGDGRNHK